MNHARPDYDRIRCVREAVMWVNSAIARKGEF
jgi:hypothetical protein